MSFRNDGEKKIENGLPVMPDVGRYYNSGSGNSDAKKNGINFVNVSKAGARLRSRLYGGKNGRRAKRIL